MTAYAFSAVLAAAVLILAPLVGCWALDRVHDLTVRRLRDEGAVAVSLLLFACLLFGFAALAAT